MDFCRLISSLAFLALPGVAFSQDNLAEARAMGPGTAVTVMGTVTNGGELGTIRYIQDETAGLAIYDLDVNFFVRGDDVTVTGVLDEFNHLLEVMELTDWTVNSSGNPLPVPRLVTLDEFGEEIEGQLIRVNQVTFVNGGDIFAGSTNYDVTSGGETGQVRISINSDLVGQVIPTGPVDLVGHMSQYHLTNPDLGYQLLLRDRDDILPGDQIAVTSSLTLSNLTTTGFDLSWKTNISGSSQLFYGHTPAFELGVLSGTGGDTLHTVSVTPAASSSLFYARAFSVANGDTAFTGMRVFITASRSGGDIKVYFTSAVDHSVSTGLDAVQIDDAADDTLIAYIDRARESIDAAIYNFGAYGISNIAAAFNNAYDRGVKIRIIVNGNTANEGLAGLDAAIPRLASPTGGEETGIMHNKFMVFDAYTADPDEALVWTGSTNWTSSNINTDANNIIIIQDKSLAIGYTLEFNEMWGGSGEFPNAGMARFGAAKTDDTPHEYLVGGKPVYSYFSPSDGVNGRIIEAINTADADIEVNTMLITRSDIGYALDDRNQAGVVTRVIVNSGEDCSETVVNTLKAAIGSNFRAYDEDGILHSKCMIVDQSDPGSDPLVLAGSHNWSNSADTRNDENTLVIHNGVIANLFFQEFSERFRLGTPLAITDKVSPGIALDIRPNPSDGNFRLTVPEPTFSKAWVKLFSPDGRLAWQLNVEKSGSEVSVRAAQLPPGVYVVEFGDGNSLFRDKVIISR